MHYPKPERSAAPTITGIVGLVIGFVLAGFAGSVPGMTVIGALVALAGLITLLVGISMALNNIDNMAANYWAAVQHAEAAGSPSEADRT